MSLTSVDTASDINPNPQYGVPSQKPRWRIPGPTRERLATPNGLDIHRSILRMAQAGRINHQTHSASSR